eukprot:NODE_8489_length_1492_cov_3.559707.p1 GENE.NODE_8489_length_1492_cov_3.559707~~NODE_8489_length_1492_cov_3.559707.p1  ORF type:complete len:376 (-),score=115.57 NODE_8489_length_1492_cov_3.559707:365-1432(-)
MEEESSPRSPRHLRSSYCSALVVSHSPVAVVVRATFSGLVEILVFNGTLGPSFDRRGGGDGKETAGSLKCTIFEELDLAMATSPLQLSLAPAPTAHGRSIGGEPVLIVRARMLVAAIQLPWLGVLCSATDAPIESLPPATVTTVAEVPTTDGPVEIVAWQPLFGAGEAADPDGGIATVLKALSSVQGGQLADLTGRQEVLKHLSGAVSERASITRADLQDLLQTDEELRRMAEECGRRVECVQDRQRQLEDQQSALVASLKTEVELLELDAVAVDELPQLWAQLHELQHALSLLRVASNPDLAGIHRGRLAMLEGLQRTWTEVAGNQLRSQVEQAEEAVAALTSKTCWHHHSQRA